MNFIILGPQGCGKGTQAKLLAEKFDLAHIEMGSALRKQAAENTPLGKKLDEIVNKKRELVADDIVAAVIQEEVKRVTAGKGIILDGAPRKMSQIAVVDGAFSGNNRKLDQVIFVDISEKESIARISLRAGCSVCGKIIKIGQDVESVENKCPACGGKLEQRKDDTVEGVKKRLAIFNQETKPVIDYYTDQKLLRQVNGERSVEEVFGEIIKGIEELDFKKNSG